MNYMIYYINSKMNIIYNLPFLKTYLIHIFLNIYLFNSKKKVSIQSLCHQRRKNLYVKILK